jgi:hypothetical protein
VARKGYSTVIFVAIAGIPPGSEATTLPPVRPCVTVIVPAQLPLAATIFMAVPTTFPFASLSTTVIVGAGVSGVKVPETLMVNPTLEPLVGVVSVIVGSGMGSSIQVDVSEG